MPALVFVRSFETRKTRNQDNYGTLRVNLGAAHDFAEVDAKIWGLDAVCNGDPPPAASDILEVDHQVEEYQGKPQWIIRGFKRLAGAERERAMEQFRPPRRIDFEYYQALLDNLIDQTDVDRVCGRLLRAIFDRASFREAFYAAPAARDHHQNYPGGLLEHTLNVTSLALALADAYGAAGQPGLTFNRQRAHVDRQVLIAAGLLHDIGKLDTYKFDPLPEITPTNNWEGHLALSYAIVRGLAAPLLAEPPYAGAADEIHKLLHCILSHHGALEFGSPVVPACVEAFLLSQADMTDARVAEIAEAGHAARRRDPAAQWLPRNMHFKGGIYIGDWPVE